MARARIPAEPACQNVARSTLNAACRREQRQGCRQVTDRSAWEGTALALDDNFSEPEGVAETLARLRESERRLQLALSAGRGIGTWDWA